ncbi:MAG: HAMP domain-containing sensor histidine kinase [Bacteroidota bacterium]
MKIRQRLALIHTFSAFAVLLGLSLFIYFFSTDFRSDEFFNRLRERVVITEQLYVEADRLDPDVLRDIREKFLHTLEEEEEYVIKVPENQQPLIDSLKNIYLSAFVERVFKDQIAEFEDGDRQGVAQLFHDPKGDYLIIVTAIDVYGIRKSTNLRGIILVGLLASLLLLFPISLITAKRALQPITQKIRKAQKITADNLHVRLRVFNEKDEIGQLANTFNQMLDRLETAFEMQKNFISNASHEIRNPITAIQGESEVILQKERSPQEYQESLQTINQESNRLAALVTALLDLAKTGFDDAKLQLKAVRLDELLFDIVAELSQRKNISPVHFLLEDLPENSDELIIQGNAQLLRVAFLNLLENAAKFSYPTPVELSLSIKDQKQEVIIRDHGIGIPQEDLKHILEPLYRAQNARAFKGFGIGLAMTDRILRLHCGTLAFTSRENEGTTVRVSFC